MGQREVDLQGAITSLIYEQERAAVEQEREERERVKRENSPEARRAAIEADHEAAEARAALAAKSKAFLVRTGQMTEAMVGDMTDTEALRTVGAEATPYAEMGWEQKNQTAEAIIADGSYAEKPLVERMKIARDLNGSVQSFDSYSIQSGKPVKDAPQIDGFTQSLIDADVTERTDDE